MDLMEAELSPRWSDGNWGWYLVYRRRARLAHPFKKVGHGPKGPLEGRPMADGPSDVGLMAHEAAIR